MGNPVVAAGQPAAPAQIDLFIAPMEVRWCTPMNLGSADANQICRGMDGCDYVIKDGKTGGSTPLTPHSEWFCTRLGEVVGIAAPGCKVMRMADGSHAFGSRWEGGVVNPTATTPAPWYERVKSGLIPKADVVPTLSRIYAFDHFVHNVDRHCNNFIVRNQQGGHTVLANDYSRAWLCNGFPLPGLPMLNNTVHAQRYLCAEWGGNYIDQAEVDAVLESIRQVSTAGITRIIEEHPRDWLTDAQRDGILTWWGTKPMLDRLDGISTGVQNGTYL